MQRDDQAQKSYARILARNDGLNGRLIDEVMADFDTLIIQHRHQCVVPENQRRITIDIDFLPAEIQFPL